MLFVEMAYIEPLNLFYEEPENDRWFPLDRYPRRVIRRLVRGKARPGGHMRVFLNLCAGLDKVGISYRVNDYQYIQQHPKEVACIVGKPHVLDKVEWKNPILFGAAGLSHPCDDPKLLERLTIRAILVPGEWERTMCEPYYGNKVIVWPVGIETDKWKPIWPEDKDIDILIYDKIRWDRERYESELINPIKSYLKQQNLKLEVIRYGSYQEKTYHNLLDRSKAMIFLCEHETQGIAYQQALSCGVPILAWDRNGFWQDPSYYPQKVKFGPVSSVPYWDSRCGIKFKNISEFPTKLEDFLNSLKHQKFASRDYIMENLTLERCAQNYVKIFKEIQ
jgi:glycosyltransferase involved in cell wall biosynthesis